MELLPLPPLSTAGSSTGVATDITEGNQGDKKCSYSDHVEQQFWEYVAQIELVYMLATDEETRALLVEAVKKSAREGSINALNGYGQYLASRSAATQFRELAKLYFPDIEEKIARGLVDNDTHNAYLDHLARANKIEREGQQAKKNADAFVKEAADKFYKELTQRLEECGWFYASATLATDAALIAAEALATAGIGVAALKGLRLSANIITKGAKKAGEKAIPVAVAAQIHLQSGAVVTKTFSIAHLKGRYGTPMEHHAGTLAKEKNRGRSDGSDEKDETEQSGKDTRPKTKKTTRTRGNNTNEIEYDAETGRPIRAKGVLKEDFGSSKRGDNATKIGKLGDSGDQGGHLAGHRFMGDTPDEGIAPQAGNLNQGAWKTMENEWADWIKKGYQVEYDIKVIPPGAVRPDAFDVSYKVVDPKTGKMRYKDKPSFENEAGETFDRIYFRDM